LMRAFLLGHLVGQTVPGTARRCNFPPC